MTMVENSPHKYADSFGNGCCERVECGLDASDPVHHRRFYPPTESDVMPHGGVQGRPYVDAHRERIRAHAKHDAKDGSMERKAWDNPIWLPVLTEEVGEVARVLCENELGNLGDEAKVQLREELVQVAAMTCAWIDALDLSI